MITINDVPSHTVQIHFTLYSILHNGLSCIALTHMNPVVLTHDFVLDVVPLYLRSFRHGRAI